MSDYEAVRSRETVTSASRALNALRSWVNSKSRRPLKGDLEEILRSLMSGPTIYRKSLAPTQENDLPPASRVFDAFIQALKLISMQTDSSKIFIAWEKFLPEISRAWDSGGQTSLNPTEAELVTRVLEGWLHALLQKPKRVMEQDVVEAQ